MYLTILNKLFLVYIFLEKVIHIQLKRKKYQICIHTFFFSFFLFFLFLMIYFLLQLEKLFLSLTNKRQNVFKPPKLSTNIKFMCLLQWFLYNLFVDIDLARNVVGTHFVQRLVSYDIIITNNDLLIQTSNKVKKMQRQPNFIHKFWGYFQ